MSWFSVAAIYFVIWWLTLFVVLPFGVRTQGEDASVTPGTDEGAPSRPRLPRILIWTTAVSAMIFAAYYVVTVTFGMQFDSIPRFVPNFD